MSGGVWKKVTGAADVVPPQPLLSRAPHPRFENNLDIPVEVLAADRARSIPPGPNQQPPADAHMVAASDEDITNLADDLAYRWDEVMANRKAHGIPVGPTGRQRIVHDVRVHDGRVIPAAIAATTTRGRILDRYYGKDTPKVIRGIYSALDPGTLLTPGSSGWREHMENPFYVLMAHRQIPFSSFQSGNIAAIDGSTARYVPYKDVASEEFAHAIAGLKVAGDPLLPNKEDAMSLLYDEYPHWEGMLEKPYEFGNLGYLMSYMSQPDEMLANLLVARRNHAAETGNALTNPYDRQKFYMGLMDKAPPAKSDLLAKTRAEGDGIGERRVLASFLGIRGADPSAEFGHRKGEKLQGQRAREAILGILMRLMDKDTRKQRLIEANKGASLDTRGAENYA